MSATWPSASAGDWKCCFPTSRRAMEYQVVYLVLAAVFGLFMAWGIGANDVANAMATSIGSGALTIRQAERGRVRVRGSRACRRRGRRRGIIETSFVVGF